MEPKVFISHASEDKQRFVLDFAKTLRRQGIDAWVDTWEMLPGDSLVDKVFKGIEQAEAVVIVLSTNSVNKPWIREELNAGFLRRIKDKIKLIPVIIDNCEIPECLQTTVHEEIKDLNNYNNEMDRIVMAIFGQSDKPPIGTPPIYVNTVIKQFDRLTKVDSMILKISCEKTLEYNIWDMVLEPKAILKGARKYGINEASFMESLEILGRKGYVNLSRVAGGFIQTYKITTFGFNEYVDLYIDDFEEIVHNVCLLLVNKMISNEAIAAELHQPEVLVNHIFNLLRQSGLINFTWTVNSQAAILSDISPELRRRLC